MNKEHQSAISKTNHGVIPKAIRWPKHLTSTANTQSRIGNIWVFRLFVCHILCGMTVNVVNANNQRDFWFFYATIKSSSWFFLGVNDSNISFLNRQFNQLLYSNHTTAVLDCTGAKVNFFVQKKKKNRAFVSMLIINS